jgi:hypothetical protein
MLAVCWPCACYSAEEGKLYPEYEDQRRTSSSLTGRQENADRPRHGGAKPRALHLPIGTTRVVSLRHPRAEPLHVFSNLSIAAAFRTVWKWMSTVSSTSFA